jgi:hypothetical protein
MNVLQESLSIKIRFPMQPRLFAFGTPVPAVLFKKEVLEQ